MRVLALDLALLTTSAKGDLEIGLLVYNTAPTKIGPYFETNTSLTGFSIAVVIVYRHTVMLL